MRRTSRAGKPLPCRLRGRMPHAVAALIVTGLAACLSVDRAACQEKPKAHRPLNVVFILADDLG
jgi:hypothetical protein